MTNAEFREVAISGGIVTIEVRDNGNGLALSFGYRHSRPVPCSLWSLWAISPGIPLGFLPMGGIGSPMPPRPLPDAVPVYMPCDSEGKFGRECRRCNKKWRDEGAGSSVICPYCGLKIGTHNTLTAGQRKYLHAYFEKLDQALRSTVPGSYEIDLDQVADAANDPDDRPEHFFSEEAQQNAFRCSACNAYNDILGTTGYCALCGSRSDLDFVQRQRMPSIRARIHSGASSMGDCIRDVISLFDGVVRQLIDQLLVRVPLRRKRAAPLEQRSFQALKEIVRAIDAAFAIDMFDSLSESDQVFCSLMFYRRHVYEHNGGLVDARYLEVTGDNVRLGQALRDSSNDVQRLTELVVKMIHTLVDGFHEIFPPMEGPIKREQTRQAREAA